METYNCGCRFCTQFDEPTIVIHGDHHEINVLPYSSALEDKQDSWVADPISWRWEYLFEGVHVYKLDEVNVEMIAGNGGCWCLFSRN